MTPVFPPDDTQEERLSLPLGRAGRVREVRLRHSQGLQNRHGDTYPDLPWEPKAAFTTLAD
jgi:hypothetical protein